MQHSKTRTWANDDNELVQPVATANSTDKTEEAEKVTEKPVKKPKVKTATPSHSAAQDAPVSDAANADVDTQEDPMGAEEQPKSDADWLRSKTSRLLGLVDDEEEAQVKAPSPASEDDSDKQPVTKITQPEEVPESSGEEEEIEEERDYDADMELIRTSGRLFLRNLAYGATDADLEPVFAPYGKIDEVSLFFLLQDIALVMIILIGTSDAFAYDVNRKRILVDASCNLKSLKSLVIIHFCENTG